MTPAKTKKTTVKREPKPIPELAPNPFAFEVLDLASRQRAKARKIEVLKKYDDASIRTLFIWNYDNSVITVLPSGEVPYSSLKDEQNTSGTLTTNINQQANTMRFNDTTNANQGHTTLRREWTKLYNFIKGGNDSLNGLRRETMFIQILEGLHPLDAEILCLVKDKKLQTKYRISRENVEQAYPDIEWGGRS